jgi:transcriptional regulator with XRE-family HTH domain
MNTKTKKSSARLTLEKMNGGPLSLGSALYAWRKSQDLTQADAAKRLHVSKQYLSQLEKRHKFASPEAAIGYAKALGLSQKLFLQLCLQDQLLRAGAKFKVNLEAA